MWEAFPDTGHIYGVEELTFRPWLVVRRENGLIPVKRLKEAAKFIGPNAETDAKCHAAKLNERESGVEPKEVSEAGPYRYGMENDPIDPEFEVR